VHFYVPRAEPESKNVHCSSEHTKERSVQILCLGHQLLFSDGQRCGDDGAGNPRPPILLQPLDAGQLPHDLRLLPAPRRRPGQRAERPEVVAGLVVPEYGAPRAVGRQVAQCLERVRRVEERAQRAGHQSPRRALRAATEAGVVRVEPEQRRALGEKRVPRRHAAVRLQDVRGAHGRVQRLVRVEARVGAEHAVEALEQRDGVARVAAREGPGHDVAVHGHGPDVRLADAQGLKDAVPATEHGRRPERDHRVQRVGRHHAARQQHEADQHREAAAERVAREPQPRRRAPRVRPQVRLDLRYDLLVDALGRLVDAPVHQHASALELGGLEQEVGLPRRQRVGALDDEAPGPRVRLVAHEPLARRRQRRPQVACRLLPRLVLGGHHRRHGRRGHVRGHARVVEPALTRCLLLPRRRAEREQAARARVDVGRGRRRHLVGQVRRPDGPARLRAGSHLVRRRGARPRGVRVQLGAYDAGLRLLLQRRRHEPQPVVPLQLLDLKPNQRALFRVQMLLILRISYLSRITTDRVHSRSTKSLKLAGFPSKISGVK
jgi:hypothetical protein